MPNTYNDSTMQEVCCWTAGTRIKYAKNPKRGKSFARYNKYMKATTPAKALEYGSKPQDLFFDFEHGYIKVLGGSRRAKPLDIANQKEDWTQTDIMLAKMQRAWKTWKKTFTVADKLGVDRRSLTSNKAGAECTEVRAARLAANALAEMVLEDVKKSKRTLTDRDVVAVLRMWGFKENTSRGNVMKEGQKFVFSDTLGLVANYTGSVSVASATSEYRSVSQVLCGWLKDHLPAEYRRGRFGFTSINVNANYAGALHRDGNNEGPSLIKAFGDFSGGELNYWGDDDKTLGSVEKCCRPDECTTMNIKKHLLLFDGNRGHSVNDFEGERFSLVFFCIGQYHKANAAVRNELSRCGINFPTAAGMAATRKMLGTPSGYGTAASKKKANGKASACCWKLDVVAKKGVDFLTAAKAKQAQDIAYKRDRLMQASSECKDTKFTGHLVSYVLKPDGCRSSRVFLTGISGGQRLAVVGEEEKAGSGLYTYKKAESFPLGPALETRRMVDVRAWLGKVLGKPVSSSSTVKRCISSRANDDERGAKKRRVSA